MSTFTSPVVAGALVQNLIGQWYQVVSGGPWRFVVQPLTPCGANLVPLGGPVTVGRSELRLEAVRS